MRIISAALAAWAIATSSTAFAWEQDNSEEKCQFSQAFESGTMLFVGQTKWQFDSEVALVAIFDEGWSVTKDTPTTGRLKITGDDGGWMDAEPLPMEKGIGGFFKEKWLKENFDSITLTGVRVTLGTKTLAILDWQGFWSAMRDFDRCRERLGWLAERKAKKEEADRLEREKRYRKIVPDDPFAKPLAPTPKQ